MKIDKATPGPWYFRLEAVRTVIFHKTVVGEKAIAVGAGSYPDHIANARLIAAAPDLLEALTRMCQVFPTDVDMAEAGWNAREIDDACNAYDAARAAIAKATGEAP